MKTGKQNEKNKNANNSEEKKKPLQKWRNTRKYIEGERREREKER